MKKTTNYLALLLFITTLLIGYNSKAQDSLNTTNNTEFELLVNYLEANGNFINSELAPALILAQEIKENLKNKKYLVLDIRSESWFEYGHIKNSKNVKGPELLNYFNNEIDPATFDKITIICYSGQSASYYTSLLRLYGFNNVYSLKWGMSSWDEEFATNIWIKNSKDEFTDQLETTANPIPEKGTTPTLSTGKTDAKEILQTRIKEAFAKPYKEFIVKSPIAFEAPQEYFIVNYMDEAKYNLGHLKGAVQYQPRSLALNANLLTLPADKKILVNCITGLSAAYTVAYLHILGYDVYNLAYGTNSYMNSVLVEKGCNDGFTTNEIKNYPIVE